MAFRVAWLLLACAWPATAPGQAAAALPASTLAVERDGGWRVWWRSGDAPRDWPAPLALVGDAIQWRRSADGVSWGALRLAGSGEARRVSVIVVRVDPALLDVRLDVRRRGTRAHPWSVDDATDSAMVALNAGQFSSGGPWGWVVHRGAERRPPGRGPLAPAVVVDAAGRVRIVSPDSIGGLRGSARVREAFQSYPALLVNGLVPEELSAPGRGVDVAHRDARLALGILPDGSLLVALTRFDGFGDLLSRVPLGLTTPEMSAVMGALGCRDAVMLDGGISGQLLVRDTTGVTHAWRGLRRVPLGLVVIPRRDD